MWFQRKALGYLDEVFNSARGQSYVLTDVRGDSPRDTVHAVRLKRSCLLSASLPRSSSHRTRKVGFAKDLLPTVSNLSTTVESLEHVLAHAVDGEPGTYFESKKGSSFEDVVSSSG